MNPSRLTMRHLEVLREIGRHPTWADAGDALGMAQSSVSQAVDRMEALVGVALFEASGARRVPTRAGRELIDLAGRVLDDLADTRERIEGRPHRGVLRVGVIDAVALYLFPASLDRFGRQHPQVELQVTVDVSDTLVGRLGDRTLDVVVVSGPQDTLVVDEVAVEALRIYGAFGPRTPCVLYPEDSRTRALIDAGLAAAGIGPRVMGTAPNPAVLHRLAGLGGVWTVLPESVATHEGPGELTQGPVVAHRSIVAVRRHREDLLVEAFVAALGEDYRGGHD